MTSNPHGINNKIVLDSLNAVCNYELNLYSTFIQYKEQYTIRFSDGTKSNNSNISKKYQPNKQLQIYHSLNSTTDNMFFTTIPYCSLSSSLPSSFSYLSLSCKTKDLKDIERLKQYKTVFDSKIKETMHPFIFNKIKLKIDSDNSTLFKEKHYEMYDSIHFENFDLMNLNSNVNHHIIKQLKHILDCVCNQTIKMSKKKNQINSLSKIKKKRTQKKINSISSHSSKKVSIQQSDTTGINVDDRENENDDNDDDDNIDIDTHSENILSKYNKSKIRKNIVTIIDEECNNKYKNQYIEPPWFIFIAIDTEKESKSKSKRKSFAGISNIELYHLDMIFNSSKSNLSGGCSSGKWKCILGVSGFKCWDECKIFYDFCNKETRGFDTYTYIIIIIIFVIISIIIVVVVVF